MNNKFLISESEKNRILNLHKNATKKQYLFEQVTEEDKTLLGQQVIKRYNYLNEGTNLDVFAKYLQGKKTAEGVGSINGNVLTVSEVKNGPFYVGGLIKTDTLNKGKDVPRIVAVLTNEIGDDVKNQKLESGNVGTYLLDKSVNTPQNSINIYQGDEGMIINDSFNRLYFDNLSEIDDIITQHLDDPTGLGNALYEMNSSFFDKTPCLSQTSTTGENGITIVIGKMGPAACRTNSNEQCFMLTRAMDAVINSVLVKYETDQSPGKGEITQWQCD
jgi:hypothetical protein